MPKPPHIGSVVPPAASEGEVRGAFLSGIKSRVERDFPDTDTFRTTIDVAYILQVDSKLKTLKVHTLRTNRIIGGVQWVCPMFDPATGHGSYGTPKKGMMGLLLILSGGAFLVGMTGVIDAFEDTGYSNDREEVPQGSWVTRTSRETKQIWSPNLILLQAAHFCKVLLKRVDKLIYALFYSFTLQSLNGFIKWTQDITNRVSSFAFKFRDRLPAKRDVDGNKAKREEAYEVSLDLGTIKEDEDQILRMRMGQALGPQDSITTETGEVRALRTLLNDKFEEEGVDTYEDLEAHPELGPSFLPWVSLQDLTRDNLIASIVGAATFTDNAFPDALNGLLSLYPEVASIEDLSTGDLTEATDPLPPLDENFQQYLPSNPVENLKVLKEGEEEESLTIASDLIKKARTSTVEETLEDLKSRLQVKVDRQGNLWVKQSKGKTEWFLEQLLKIYTTQGPFDLDTGEGIRVRARQGMLFLGLKECGVTMTQQGELIFTGRKITHQVWQDVDPLEEETKIDEIYDELGGNSPDLTAEERAAIRTQAEQARESQKTRRVPETDPNQVTDYGTVFEMTPKATSLRTAELLTLQGGAGIEIITDDRPQEVIETTEHLREVTLQQQTGISGLEEE